MQENITLAFIIILWLALVGILLKWIVTYIRHKKWIQATVIVLLIGVLLFFTGSWMVKFTNTLLWNLYGSLWFGATSR